MGLDQDAQETNYFKFRNKDKNSYVGTLLPYWIKNELSDPKQKILDYGCGFGQNIFALNKEGYQHVCGVDIEKNAIEHCLDKGAVVKELSLDSLINPFDYKFDVIILSHIIEHIPKDQIISTLSLIKNEFLCKNGKLLIAVPNAQSNTGCYWAYEDWTHTTLFTSGSLYYVLRAAGFDSIEFIDVDGTLGSSNIVRLLKQVLLPVYRLNLTFWNKVTSSAYHSPSPKIFSYEIKVKAF